MFNTTCSILLAQTPTPASQQTPQATPAPQAKSAQQVAPACKCLEGVVVIVQKAYASLEEDEWPSAIKISTDALNTINTLAKTCKCPEISAYQNVAKAFLNYAKGGNLLDGQEEPDCKAALKLYDEAISWLKDALEKITNSEVKANAKSIKEYAEEELQFVKDECEEPPPKQQTQPKASPPAKQ